MTHRRKPKKSATAKLWIASNIAIKDHVVEFCSLSRYGLTKIHIMLVYFIPQLCLNFIGNIRIITFLSLCGNVIIFACVGLVGKELLLHKKLLHSALPAVTNLEGVTMAAGGLIYAFEGQAMVLALENRLKHASDMLGLNGVLCTSMNFVTLLYAFLGFYGYLTYGESVAGSLTLNLPNTNITVALKILLVLKIFLGSALQLYVIVAILNPVLSSTTLGAFDWKDITVALKTLLVLKIFLGSALQLYVIVAGLNPVFSSTTLGAFNWKEYALRAVLMTFSLTIALFVPNLYDVIPLASVHELRICS
ncbi:transmembrane amino acid transporter protein [Oesophagostomum dentatum]|uniref:Transmembrane amino acid transporter protein n=1 Tax=Oesophagostomum dentatum TaxID=61180 RepID=A0A0B1TF31_OESDE|nr:transmembrane amino acid transporter protein [Oesophagostomum dentatum]